jgi:hypothetical protein
MVSTRLISHALHQDVYIGSKPEITAAQHCRPLRLQKQIFASEHASEQLAVRASVACLAHKELRVVMQTGVLFPHMKRASAPGVRAAKRVALNQQHGIGFSIRS